MMTRRISQLLTVAMLASAVTNVALGQDSGRRGGRDGDRGDRGDRGGRGDRGDRFRGPISEEDRERFLDGMVDRYVRDYRYAYELTDEQEDAVRVKVRELRAQHEEYAAPLREEFEQMREQRRQLWEQRRETEDDEAIEQQMRDLSDKMRRMFTESPLLNRDNVTETVESILPADQVKAGNDRREERRERMREEWEQRREQFGNRFGGRGNDDNDGPGGRGGPRGDRWDNYVQDFSRRHNLDETQASTADSLLRDLKGQRDTYLESHASDLEAVREIEDRQARRDRYEELNAPVESLFESLQTKLDQIPTAAQKAEAESRRPTSRPARRGGPSSRPST